MPAIFKTLVVHHTTDTAATRAILATVRPRLSACSHIEGQTRSPRLCEGALAEKESWRGPSGILTCWWCFLWVTEIRDVRVGRMGLTPNMMVVWSLLLLGCGMAFQLHASLGRLQCLKARDGRSSGTSESFLKPQRDDSSGEQWFRSPSQHLGPRTVLLGSRGSQDNQDVKGGNSMLGNFMVKMGYAKEGQDENASQRTVKDRLKSAGLAGVLSYVSSEVLFWFISLPLGVLAFKYSTGDWLDVGSAEGKAQLAAFSAGFLAFARVALPVRAAVALALTPAVEKYLVRPLVERGLVSEQQQ